MAPILLVTRPVETARRFAQRIEDVYGTGFQTILSPALEIVQLDPEVPTECDHLILTSANGVRQAIRINIKVTGSVFCVGQRTADLAKSHFFSAIRAGSCAKELIERVSKQNIDGAILHLSGTHTRGDIVENLMKRGLKASRAIAYDQRLLTPTYDAKDALKGTLPIVLPLFSTRSAGLLAQCKVNAPVHVVAISEVVKASLPDAFRQSVKVADAPDEDHMVEATVKVLDRLI